MSVATGRELLHRMVREALLHRVCRFCVDRRPSGPPCRIEGETCCVFARLEPLIEAVLESIEEDARPYLLRVRRKVCASCVHQRPDGACPLRGRSLCPLNNYLPLVVEAVEAVRYAGWKPEA